ncbi:MAG TPA: hypothetical protein VGJ84_07465 [Polyangiaceae bacterium]|jgi:hypothetical protein
MISCGDIAPLIGKRLAELTSALDGATAEARSLCAACAPDALSTIESGAIALLSALGRAAYGAHLVAVLCEQALESDALAELPNIAEQPGDTARAQALDNWLCTAPGWGDVELPSNLDPVIERINRDIAWLAQRGFSPKDQLRALGTLKSVRATLRLFESVIAAIVEDWPESPPYSTMLDALALARTRLHLRRSREEGTS